MENHMAKKIKIPLIAGTLAAAGTVVALSGAGASTALAPSHSSVGTTTSSIVHHAGTVGLLKAAESKGTDEAPAVAEEPTAVTATPGDSSAVVNWTAPTTTTGTITGYVVQTATAEDGPWTVAADQVAGTTTPLSGLTNGTTYFVRVAAEVGTAVGEFSRPVAVTPSATPAVATVPGAIARGEVESSDEGTTTHLHWAAPLSDGGSPITGYEVDVSTDGGATWTAVGAPVTDTRLDVTSTAGAQYRVAAINAVGTGAFTTLASDEGTEGSMGHAPEGLGGTSGGEHSGSGGTSGGEHSGSGGAGSHTGSAPLGGRGGKD